VATSADTFPAGFLVGASTSAHQVEGNNLGSDWWALENRDGTPLPERSGDACDSLHRWREDIDLLASLGLNAYRFSIEWARVEPAPGQFSAAMVEHYATMVRYAIERGLQPVLTLHHFTHPLWFTRAGGWEAPDALDRFSAYTAAVAPVIDAGVRTVITINEPNILAVMQTVVRGEGELATGLGGGLPHPHRPTAEALAAAHTRTAAELRRRHPGVAIGWSIANQCVQHLPGGEQQAAAYRHRHEDWYLEHSKADDVVGVQAYTRTIIGPDGIVPPAPEAARTQMGWEYYPPAVGEAVRRTRTMVGDVPVLVTENGIATSDDTQRIAYTTGALQSLAAAIADGVDVRGYLHWSALDNYEWGRWDPTFGLIAVDRNTFARTPKPSAAWLGEIARTGRVPAEAR